MANRYARPYVRALKNSYRSARRSIDLASPGWLERILRPVLERFDLYFVDHGVFRLLYTNRHHVAGQVWRASQPAPHQIRRYARQGIRTIVNLRGGRDCGSYRLERAACARYGITLVDFVVKSREAPAPDTLHQAKALFESIDYPVLMHCKSGADRVGLMSVLYLHFHGGRSLEQAVKQLSLRYGHVRQSDTGILDHVFERYLEHNRDTPTDFFAWVVTHYNPKTVMASFRAKSWANVLVNRLLDRE